jgi:hypothetical protein
MPAFPALLDLYVEELPHDLLDLGAEALPMEVSPRVSSFTSVGSLSSLGTFTSSTASSGGCVSSGTSYVP